MPSFERINYNLTRRATDESVEFLNRWQIQYEIGDKKVIFEKESMAGGPYTDVLYPRSIKQWQTPHGIVEVTEAEREQVIQAVNEALECLNISFMWDHSPPGPIMIIGPGAE